MKWTDDCDYCDYHMEFISIFGEWCYCDLKRHEHDEMKEKKARHCDYVCHDTLKERLCKKTQIPIL